LLLRVGFLTSIYQTMRTTTMPPKDDKPNVSSVSDTIAKEQLALEREKLQLAREMLQALGLTSAVVSEPVKIARTVKKSVQATPVKPPRQRSRLRDIDANGEKETSAHITETNYASGLERQEEILGALKASKLGAMTQPELAEKLGRTRGNIKHHLDNMAARGLIVRTDAKIGGHLTTVAGLDFDALAKWHKSREKSNRA
jgi:biotin operon repressor